ncbi:MAG: hypothetical protein LBI81_00320 [Puniceicoccales bacterium]|jgi:hypothetical protein|nr:hypothetical protein [Puniceicoccales bacterium]
MPIEEIIQISQAEEQLINQIQEMMADTELDVQEVSDLLHMSMPNPDDVVKFNGAINYTGAPNEDLFVSMQNLDQALVNVGHTNSAEANAIGDTIRQDRVRISDIGDRLDGQMAEARLTDAQYEGKLSHFFSSVQKHLRRITSVVADLSRKPDLSQGDLMRIQYEITQMGIMLDVASKVGDKGSQALQTLFRDK